MSVLPVGSAGSRDASDVLTIEGLCIDFTITDGVLRVVENVDLSLKRGETLALVGESASGKTVTGLAVLGLLPVNGRIAAGRITLDGVDLMRLSRRHSRRQLRRFRGGVIGMIFQEPRRSLDPSFSVGYQIAEGIRAHLGLRRDAAWNRAVQMLDRVHIPDAARRAYDYPHQFSGGMCQRVMIAQALACEPRVLIADEPTTALDVTVQADILRLLCELRDDMKLSILLITHDLGVVAESCDHVVVMYAGQVVEQGRAVEVFTSPRHPYTAALIAAMPQAGSNRGTMLRAIPGTVPSPYSWPDGCRFHPRCAFADERCRSGRPALTGPHQRLASRCLRQDELQLEGIR